MNNIYTGIGSRKTTQSILDLMEDIGFFMAIQNWTLRSGGADGSDFAFEKGCKKANGKSEIFLPWKYFNGNLSQHYDISDEAIKIAKKFHPKFESLSPRAKKLISRNTYQILGYDLKTPTNLVICWTPNGQIEGGTGQALRIAKEYDIEISNLFNDYDFGRWSKWCDEMKILYDGSIYVR